MFEIRLWVGAHNYRTMNSILKYHTKKLKYLGLKEKITVEPGDELGNIVLQHYGKFHTGEQAHSIEDIYSRQGARSSLAVIPMNGLMIEAQLTPSSMQVFHYTPGNRSTKPGRLLRGLRGLGGRPGDG